jgi:uncharacterized protein YceK
MAACLVALTALTLSGCGTVVNLTSSKEPVHTMMTLQRAPYGGVAVDAQAAAGFLRTPEPASAALGLYFLCVDLPLSLVGDTLTLPLVFYYNAHEESHPPSNPLTSRLAELENAAPNPALEPNSP